MHLLGGAVPDKIREDLIYHNIEITRNAKHVICAQSLVSDLTLSFLKLAERDDIIKVINTHQPWKSLPIDYFRKKDKALERLLEIADKGTPFLCPCNSSNQALRIYLDLQKRHPDRKYLLVTQGVATEPEQSEFLANPNKHAHKYDGVIFSPSMESGVSIDVEHFKETIGFCSANEKVGTPEAFVQQILRGRKAQR
ncbi:phage-related protein, partial [Candidatus Thiomargarita nelsonii]